HRMCAGCAAPTIIKLVGMALRGPTVICNATGCLEVATTIYPYTAWKVPWIHVAFENVAAVASGVVEAFNAMKDKGRGKYDHVDVIAIGGDGGTFDIGFGALSGALERGHDFVYLVYDNGAYQNTGIQRSGATLPGQETTTSWAGKVEPGKRQRKKPLAEIVAAHRIPYVATVSPYYWRDTSSRSSGRPLRLRGQHSSMRTRRVRVAGGLTPRSQSSCPSLLSKPGFTRFTKSLMGPST
ncbi:MAG: thiamine pyrophosphate-dependent enzyme, partial [Candidatus Thorarchaeota archaeon]